MCIIKVEKVVATRETDSQKLLSGATMGAMMAEIEINCRKCPNMVNP